MVANPCSKSWYRTFLKGERSARTVFIDEIGRRTVGQGKNHVITGEDGMFVGRSPLPQRSACYHSPANAMSQLRPILSSPPERSKIEWIA
jgi:hypothetical protein